MEQERYKALPKSIVKHKGRPKTVSSYVKNVDKRAELVSKHFFKILFAIHNASTERALLVILVSFSD